MRTIIGLGKAGCNIAGHFAELEGYKVYKIDCGLKGKGCFNFPSCASPEEAEKKTPSLKNFFKGITDEVSFIVAGGGNIPNASLAILEQIKDKNISVLYVRPDTKLLSKRAVQNEKMINQILQNYTRSGLLRKMYFFDNHLIQVALEGVTFKNLFEKINSHIVRLYDLILFYERQESVFGIRSEVKDISRISTLGIMSYNDMKHSLCFDLQNAVEKEYFYVVSEKKLEEDTDLPYKIRQHVTTLSGDKSGNLFYSLHPSDFEGVQVYCRFHTHFLQN